MKYIHILIHHSIVYHRLLHPFLITCYMQQATELHKTKTIMYQTNKQTNTYTVKCEILQFLFLFIISTIGK